MQPADQNLVWDAAKLVWESLESRAMTPVYEQVRTYLDSEPFQAGRYKCFIAYYHGVPSGCVVVESHPEQVQLYFEIHNLYVTSEYRGEHVATALLGEAVRWINSFPCESDPLIYITTKGEPRKVFSRCGFEPTHQLCVSTLSKVKEKMR